MDVVGVAAGGTHARLDVEIEGRRLLEHLLHGEDRVGIARAEIPPRTGATGLNHQRTALRRTRQLQRPLHREIATLMVDTVNPRRVREQAGFAVADQGLVLPAVPEPRDHIGELGGTGITILVDRQPVEPEVRRRAFVIGRDDVPGDAPPGRVVERIEDAGDVVGVIERRRDRSDEADLLGDRRHAGDGDDRVERPGRTGAGIRSDGQRIGKKDGIERAALGDPCRFLIVGDIDIAEAASVRCPPGSRMRSGRQDVDVDVKLALAHHRLRFSLGGTGWPSIAARVERSRQ